MQEGEQSQPGHIIPPPSATEALIVEFGVKKHESFTELANDLEGLATTTSTGVKSADGVFHPFVQLAMIVRQLDKSEGLISVESIRDHIPDVLDLRAKVDSILNNRQIQ